MEKKFILIFVLLLSLLFIPLVNSSDIPKINSYVTDNANVLSPSVKSNLEDALASLEKSTNNVQFIVYIDKNYPKDYSFEEYALKIAEANKIGKKGNDNGILLYVAIDERAYRWEVGYGIESTLSASLLGRISREHLLPNFKKGDYGRGITESVNLTSRILMGSNDADIANLKENRNPSSDFFKTSLIAFAILLIIVLIVYAISKPAKKMPQRKQKNDYYKGAASGLFLGGFGRGGFGGSGGFGGGGFGGFSGGGGSFGGGGFSGRW